MAALVPPPSNKASIQREQVIFQLADQLKREMQRGSDEISSVLRQIEREGLVRDPEIINTLKENLRDTHLVLDRTELLPFIEKHRLAKPVVEGLQHCLGRLAKSLVVYFEPLEELLNFIKRNLIQLIVEIVVYCFRTGFSFHITFQKMI